MSGQFREVRLYYPNMWRKYIGDLASNEDKRFNWFLCSQRYRDSSSGLYIIEIAKGAKFYDEESGDTLVVKKDQNAKMLILDDPNNVSIRNMSPKEIMRLIKNRAYQGYAHLQECRLKNPDQLVVCREAVFNFINDVLESSKKERVCEIIDYAKKNNTCLKAFLPSFPSSQEIDAALKEYSHQTVCKVLYQDIIKYAS